MTNIEERGKYIVSSLENGTESIVSLGRKYNITRERVSQIYYTITGKKRGELREHRSSIRDLAKEKVLSSYKFTCAGCGKDVDHREGHYKRKFCLSCHELSQNKKVSLETTYTCTTCGKKYHPFTNSKHPRKSGYFCSLICYHKFQGRNKK